MRQKSNNQIEDATYPFELYFNESVSRVKEEISERKYKHAQETSMLDKGRRQSESTHTDDQGGDGLNNPYVHKSIFNKFDLEVDHVKLGQFTEHDKRRVLEEFMSNEEVLYFLYGILFPNSTQSTDHGIISQTQNSEFKVSGLPSNPMK